MGKLELFRKAGFGAHFLKFTKLENWLHWSRYDMGALPKNE